MRKVRSLPIVDYGCRSAHQGTTHTGSGPETTIDLDPALLKDKVMWLHDGAITKTFSDYAMAGSEVFESTERRRPKFNECMHSKAQSVNYLLTMWWLNYGGTRPAWERLWRKQAPVMTFSPAADLGWDTISSNIQAEAYHTMIPRFEGDISLANFIFEMKDFRDLSKLLSRKTFQWLNSANIPALLSSGTKRLATLHLANNFAIDPATRDLSQIVMQAQRLVMEAQEDFARKGLQPNIRHFSKTLDQSQSFVQKNVLSFSRYSPVQQGTKISSVFTATMEGDYGYQARGSLDAFMKYWGLQLTAEAVWNALPFSFLADYFLSIGHSLNVMRHDKNVSYHVRQYSESLLTTKELGYFIQDGTGGYGRRAFVIDNRFYEAVEGSKKTYLLCGIRSTHYKRRVISPYWGPFLPRWTIPSGKQGLNMLALLRCLI